MAWSPFQRANAEIIWVEQPGDFAQPNSNHLRDGTGSLSGRSQSFTDAPDRLPRESNPRDRFLLFDAVCRKCSTPINTCSIAQRLDRIQVAQIVEAERDSGAARLTALAKYGGTDRQAPSDEGRIVAFAFQAGDMLSRGRRRVITRRRLPLPLMISSVPAASLNCDHLSAVN